MSRLPRLRIKNLEPKYPIIQGGMGAKVSLHKLASAVANAGGIGVISAVLLHEKDRSKPKKRTCKGIDVESVGLKPYHYAWELAEEIRKAKELSPNGIIGVNIMYALTHFYELLMTAIDAGADLIIQGAGFGKDVFKICNTFDVPLIEIVATPKGAKLSERLGASAVIVESGEAGGHLGTMENLWDVLPKIVDAVDIPVIAAGGIFDGKDIARAFEMGAKGVQIATRFIATYECDAAPEFKEYIIKAKPEDSIYIKSPVGMPAHAVRNPFTERLEREGKIPHKCPFNCLKTCSGEDSIYCIADVLLKSVSGDVERGLVFSGSNVGRVNRMYHVKELIEELVRECEEELERRNLNFGEER
ncbi:NAD(P)H-dependent flavin oxidoreductase YrpB, nitropropane dioxygenase family [Balnearium lithotrophicum]|uniref:NAD(P)H-dependent flavin oxidoreductase YrpB, nitropropane dioxygenase family n=1 Tax=Balnearium lithotrophicum TaxID=223788 RepID=A0A521CBQ4_9BACT|nr:nitronate monooxygenase [Balnearium lithotrophicum]SMO56869.1 NAD(P)H-dependent flavin oxidoreductase YrpB, nitropropane dioxygenase family [Balnearium lithotrophicum]